ncbi:paraquat-inducible protein A [Silvimonas sp. JCM 19000]
MIDSHLIACHECDLLLQPPQLAPGAVACCPRCGATLYREIKHGHERVLAFALAAVVLYLLANCFPIMSLEISGTRVSCTLIGAAQALWNQGIQTLSILVMATSVIVPGLQLLILLYLLIPLQLRRMPPYVPELLRTLQLLRPWSMIEVFMLGILVSLSKLAAMAQVIPGIALWSFAVLMFMMTAVFAAFDARRVWRMLPVLQ